MFVQLAIALLIYPGLLLALGLSALYAALTASRGGGAFVDGAALRAAVQNGEGLLNVASALLAGLGLALLPWPYHPLDPGPAGWFVAWALLEAAFVLPVLPGLLAGWPPLVRAASRELQIGVTGRALLWAALAIGLATRTDWSLAALPVHGLALLAALFAFPAAVGWGPFAAETSITPGGMEHGLDAATATLARATRALRSAALLAAGLVALLPVAPLQPWLGLVWLAAGFLLAGAVLNRTSGLFPRLTLVGALQRCWWRALPLSVAAAVYLAVISSR